VITPYHRAVARRLVSPTVVGRTQELASLERALQGAIDGAPVHRLVAGEAGVGKSRLVGEVATSAAERGVRVITGSCADIGDGGVPYGPIVQALRDVVRRLDDEARAAVFGPSVRELARLIPALDPGATQATSGPADAAHARLLDAILGSLQRLAEREPILFIIEDLHWADPATRETIAFLIRQIESDRIVLVMTFRADELHRRHPLLPWLAEMARNQHVERVDLVRLDADETYDLLRSILGEAPSGPLAEQIHDRSDGNPFFIEELVGTGSDREGRIPQTLREVLLARIVDLPPGAQTVVGVAAVAGRQVDHGLLATVAGMEDVAFLDSLRTAIEHQILVVGASSFGSERDYAFRHALLQEAAYDDLLPGERVRLHRAYAEALAERGSGGGALAAGYFAELAYHWSAAREDRRAFEVSVRAGEAAASAFAFADAQRHDERALELWSTIDDPEALVGIDRVTLLDRTALATWLAGDARRAVSLRRDVVAALSPAEDPIRLGFALQQLGRVLWANAETEQALEATESAVSVMPAEPPTAELARVLAGYGQLLMLVDRWSESMDQCRQAVAMAREVGARQPEGHALNTLGLGLATAGRCDESEAAFEAALAIAEEISDADDIGRGYVNLTEARFACGDKEGAVAAVREGIAITDSMGMARTYGRFIRENGICYNFELGDWPEAQRLADTSIATMSRERHQTRYGLTNWIPLLVATGDLRADGFIEELRGLIDGYLVETQFNIPFRVADAEAALWRSDPEAALAAISTGLVEVADKQWPRFHLRLFRLGIRAAADLAEIARARRDVVGETAARRRGDELWATFLSVIEDSRSRQGGQAAAENEAEFSTTTAERLRLRGEPSAEAWGQTAELWSGRVNPYNQAYALWRQAEAALADGDRTTATTAIVEAQAIADALGAVPLRAAIGSLAGRSRIDLSTVQDGADESPDTVPAMAADPFGLTPRERDVLPLLVHGRTNRQIAETLFISQNTAGVHVSNIIGKLGASSRTEAAGIAARLGLGVD
jgi:DNA-binding CsgD family transcriptional regulator/tetratricopeptide (TPR) repeat protein